MTLRKRLTDLEAKLGRSDGPWWIRTPYQQRIEHWKAAASQGLYLDFLSGEFITLEELARRDPERAALVERNTRQFQDAMGE